MRMCDLRVLTLVVAVQAAACSTTHGTDDDAGATPGMDAFDPTIDAWRDPFAPPDASTPQDARHTVRCGSAVCDEGEECCFTEGRCFDPGVDTCRFGADAGTVDAGAGTCASHSDCAPGSVCLSYGACLGVGYCHSTAGLECGSDPMCGCDGVTYPSSCAAMAAGVRPVLFGACGPSVGEQRGPIACGNDSRHCGGTECCALTGLCLPADCPECCVVTPRGTYPCNSDDVCRRHDGNTFCDADTCDAEVGACVGADVPCSGALAPVCGCDGTTYINRCQAQVARVRVAHEGECAEE